jgi:hypothetical protein
VVDFSVHRNELVASIPVGTSLDQPMCYLYGVSFGQCRCLGEIVKLFLMTQKPMKKVPTRV